MTRLRVKIGGLVVLLLIASLSSWGCSSATTRTGSIPDTRRMDAELRPGVSTKAEVQALLGKPNGYGGAVLPTDPRPHDVWFYNLIEASAHGTKGGGRVNLQMDMLLIFFEQEIYDGHMWFKDSTTGSFN